MYLFHVLARRLRHFICPGILQQLQRKDDPELFGLYLGREVCNSFLNLTDENAFDLNDLFL